MHEGQQAEALARLASAHPAARAPLARVVGSLIAAGGAPFEVIAGTPVTRYGARITFRSTTDPAALAEAAGLADHVWGVPDWIGVRTAPDGTVQCKAYHRRPPPLGISTVHRGLPAGLDPVMASLDGTVLEVYAVEPGQRSWPTFVAGCVTPLGLNATHDFAPIPRPTRHAFAVSARHGGAQLTAVTVYAATKALPTEDALLAAWTAGMSGEQRTAFGQAVVAARQLGTADVPLFDMLAWTFDASGFVSRAASLRVGA
ncbi:MAG TPA: hypothetical protein VGH30_06165 [Jatrophihabitantaceae bacterium]